MGHWEYGDRFESWGQVYHERVYVPDESDKPKCNVCGDEATMGNKPYCKYCYENMKDELLPIFENWSKSADKYDVLWLMGDILEEL